MAGRRLAIIGAGPIGLEAAVRGQRSGWDVTLIEQGSIGHHVTSWGHVRLFSPFGMNASSWGREALAGQPLPSENALLTGREFVDQYLKPLSQLPFLDGRIREHTRVIAISRGDFWKSDLIGRPQRAESPFRLLVQTVPESGDSIENCCEQIIEADVVIDCTGTFSQHNWLGAGGIPCPGERSNADRIDYQIPDVLDADRDRFTEVTTLVVGSGYSAATSVVALASLARESAGTHCLWLTRTDRTPPIPTIDDDQLTERAALASAANEFAMSADDCCPVRWLKSSRIERIERTPDNRLTVRVTRDESEPTAQSGETLIVDRIIAQVGYRPNRSLYEELQIHECYATQGPIKLAAALLGETSGDCLTQSTPGADTLRNPEPGFFILGAKSYGRDSRFLLRVGIEQIESAFSLLEDATP
ncbi:MAG: NAD(P)/FAD-dependent oxidoreductase [Planctomycetota bacterium]